MARGRSESVCEREREGEDDGEASRVRMEEERKDHALTHQHSSSPSWSFLTNALKHLYRSIGCVSMIFKLSIVSCWSACKQTETGDG